jgi:molybdate transport system permease protein
MDGWQLTSAEWTAVRLSLQVALVATLVSLPAGIWMGHVLARKQFWGKSLVETAISLPLVLPPVVTGYLLLVLLGRRGWMGSPLYQWFGIEVAFTWKAAAVASGVMAFPLMVRAIRVAFGGVDRRLEMAARTLGAGRAETFFRISMPLARRGIVAGAILAFARSMGEFGATVMVAANIPGETQTIPLLIFSQTNSPGGMEESGRLVVVAVVIAAAVLFIAEWLERRHRPGN